MTAPFSSASYAPAPPFPVGVVVAVADDPERDELVRRLHSDGRFSVLGTAGDAGTALATVVELLPEVAFVDVDLPGDGLRALAAIVEAAPAVRVVAVATDDDERAYAAVALGARGCHLRRDPVATVSDVAAGAARGEGALTQGVAGRILDEVRGLERQPGLVPAPQLNATEQEVLRRVAAGASPAAIAELHGVTVHLVNLHGGAAITKVWRHHDDARRLGAPGPQSERQ